MVLVKTTLEQRANDGDATNTSIRINISRVDVWWFA